MAGKLNRFLRGIHSLKLQHIIMALLALVAIVWGISLWVPYLQAEKEHIETVHVWTPHRAVPIESLFVGSGYPRSILGKDTHTLGGYQQLNQLEVVANFFAREENQIRYLAIVRKSDGTVSVARMTISANIPARGLLEVRNITFDPATGMVTAQYARPLFQLLVFGVILPSLFWLFVSILMAMVCGSRWNAPMFPPKRVPA